MQRVRQIARHVLESAEAAATDSEVTPAESPEYPVDPDVELIYKEFDIPSRRLQADWREQWIAWRHYLADGCCDPARSSLRELGGYLYVETE